MQWANHRVLDLSRGGFLTVQDFFDHLISKPDMRSVHSSSRRFRGERFGLHAFSVCDDLFGYEITERGDAL